MIKEFCEKSPNGKHKSEVNEGVVVEPNKEGKKLYYSDEMHCKYCKEDWYVIVDEIVMKKPIRKGVEFILNNPGKDYTYFQHLYNHKNKSL